MSIVRAFVIGLLLAALTVTVIAAFLPELLIVALFVEAILHV